MKKALVLGLVAALGLGAGAFAQTLGGEWFAEVDFTFVAGVLTTVDVYSTLDINYTVSGWTFGSSSSIDSTNGWYLQEFNVDGSLGAFALDSVVAFNPVTPAFIEWVTSAGITLAGVTLDMTFVSVPDDTAFVLAASGTAGEVDVSATLTMGTAVYDLYGTYPYHASPYFKHYWYPAVDNFDGCGFDFQSIVIDVGFPFCCADVLAEVMFTCEGFEYADFTVEGIQFPNTPWFSVDATIEFTMGLDGPAKSIIITPNFDFGAEACFDVYFGTTTSQLDPYGRFIFPGGATPFEILGFTVDGIGLTCEIGGVTFTGISYWGPLLGKYRPGLLQYHDNYWEAYNIATTDDGCCGPFAFDVTIFFAESSTLLFDVAELDAAFTIQISTQFTMGMTMGIDLLLDTITWGLTFDVVW